MLWGVQRLHHHTACETKLEDQSPGVEYRLPTSPYFSNTPGIEGLFFHISPEPVVSPQGVTRGERLKRLQKARIQLVDVIKQLADKRENLFGLIPDIGFLIKLYALPLQASDMHKSDKYSTLYFTLDLIRYIIVISLPLSPCFTFSLVIILYALFLFIS